MKKSESYFSNLRGIGSQPRIGLGGSWLSDLESVNNLSNDDINDDVDDDGEEVSKGAKTIVGQRFVVENVTEKEHETQLMKKESNNLTMIETVSIPKNNKFGKVKNIDIFSRSEIAEVGLSRSNLLDEIRRSKEMMLENMKRTDRRAKLDKQRERAEVYHMVKLKHDLDAVANQSSSEATETRDEGILSFKRQHEMSLERMKREIEDKFANEKQRLESDLEKRLREFKVQLSRKEEEEMKNLIAEMDELRMENLNKVRNELEICYEKERQDILENLKTELNQRKKELLDLRNQEMDKLQSEHDKELAEERMVKFASEQEARIKQHKDEIEAMKRQLDSEFDDLRNELRAQQREKVTKITEDHEKCLAEILRDFRINVRTFDT